MKRRVSAVLVSVGLLAGLTVVLDLGLAPSHAAEGGQAGLADVQPAGGDRYDVYVGELAPDEVGALLDLGVDAADILIEPVEPVEPAAPDDVAAAADALAVEAVVSGAEAEALAAAGIDLELKDFDGLSAAEVATQEAESGYDVYRPYSGPGGLQEEFEQLAADNPDVAKVTSIGQTIQGQEILALKLTRRAQQVPDGRRPASLMMGAQHAREWITPEVVRRFTHHLVDGYRTDPEITELLRRTEVWIIPVANPDGYDFTFEPGQRLWRKNLRDNTGDGQIGPQDGVDLNRNFATRWGFDNEGSSPNPAAQTYRGPAPMSEPENQALDAFVERIGFEFLLNVHSAAEMILFGNSWQEQTPSPDDVIYEALAGTHENPAVEGFHPGIVTDLTTANGDTTYHAHVVHGTLALTPELTTCQTASAAHPGFDPADCLSVFNFPDDEELIQAEFELNLPFMLATAQSARDPENPVSVSGLDTPDFVVDSFDVSFGDPQEVAVIARRSLRNLRLNYSVNGERPQSTRPVVWQGGERYGGEADVHFAELRGEISGTSPGDTVEVWFSGVKPREGRVESERFSYTVVGDGSAEALILANEDYTGINPVQDVDAPKHVAAYAAALEANAIDHEVFDVDADGVPHPLGVLSHFDAVVWELGDNRLTQDERNELTDTFQFGPLPDLAVAPRAHAVEQAVRDYLNEGGSLLYTGETAGYFGWFDDNFGSPNPVGGIYYSLQGRPDEDCVVSSNFFQDCRIHSDDFVQYWLGAFARTSVPDAAGVAGTGGPLDGFGADFGGPAVVDNPVDEAGSFVPTSAVLPPVEFPLFAGEATSSYVDESGAAFGASSITTDNTVLLGFGVEQLGTPEEQANVIGRMMDHLLG